ncbi:hypothetical protein [Bradyrhizobium cenepequi]
MDDQTRDIFERARAAIDRNANIEAEMAERRARLGNDAFEEPVMRRDWSPPSRTPWADERAERAAVERMNAEQRAQDAAPQFVTTELLKQFADMVGAESAINERRLRDELDERIGQLTARIELLEAVIRANNITQIESKRHAAA